MPDPPTRATGLLAAAVAALGGTERSGQIEMAEAVERAFDSGEHLAVQAGTGTGKSLAYLVPAIAKAIEASEPVVVSTATIALQRQLVDRDLPRLADALAAELPRKPVFALLKGRGNYLCLNKIHNGANTGPAEDRPQEELFDPVAATALGRDVQRLTKWSSDTETGDRDELVPGVPDRSWSQVSVSARECIGVSRCPFGTDCFSERARGKAGTADIVVTNHALLAIDAIADASVLPEHQLLPPATVAATATRYATSAVASLNSPSPSMSLTSRRGTSSRCMMAVAATGSVGDTIAPRTNAVCQAMPGITKCAAHATADIVTRTKTTEFIVKPRRLLRKSPKLA